MELGKSPVLVPRRAARNEHVDDHQQQTAQLLGCAGLFMVLTGHGARETEELDTDQKQSDPDHRLEAVR